MAIDLAARDPGDTVQVLAPDGSVVDESLLPPLDDETLVDMYADMRLARRFDERAVSLQRQGRLGTYPSLAGQEGAQVGSTYALAAEDLLTYQYREHAAVLVRDAMAPYLRYWLGQQEGNAALADVDVFPLNISIGAHVPQATGLAWAADYHDDDRVVLCHLGDGATSEGDFHEGVNFAGVFDVPAVFLVNNNQWAISVPREHQTASATLAGKADAYGIDGVQVDGMDPLATYVVTRAAREKALGEAATGEGDDSPPRPTLVEAVQYRYGAHTTADDPSVYRDEAAVEAWRERDPIERFETFLRETGRLDDVTVGTIESVNEERIAAAVDAAEAAEPDPLAPFDHVFAERTADLDRQRDALADLRERHGDDALTREE